MKVTLPEGIILVAMRWLLWSFVPLVSGMATSLEEKIL